MSAFEEIAENATNLADNNPCCGGCVIACLLVGIGIGIGWLLFG